MTEHLRRGGARAVGAPGAALDLTHLPVAVLGAGTMGRGITQLLLQAGAHVTLVDPAAEALPRARAALADTFEMLAGKGRLAERPAAVLARLATSTDVGAVGGASWVFEAAPERLELKRELFERVEEAAPGARLATNTSTLSVTAIAAGCRRPEQVVGMHFFNPAPLMKLVEVVPGLETPTHLVADAVALARALGKEPVVAQDRPGFIVNRVARPFYGEALRLAGEGADFATLDASLRAAGFRMGPFELLDLIGLDVNLAATTSVYEAFFQEPRYRPHPLQSALVTAGRLGRKSRRGFYRYDAAGRREDAPPPAGPAQPPGAPWPSVAVLGDTAAARVLREYLGRAAPGALTDGSGVGAAEVGALGHAGASAEPAPRAPLDLLIDARLPLAAKAGPSPTARCRLVLCWAHSASAAQGARAVEGAGSAAGVGGAVPTAAGPTGAAGPSGAAPRPVGFSFLPAPGAPGLPGERAAEPAAGDPPAAPPAEAPTLELLEPVTGASAELELARSLLNRLGVRTLLLPDQAGGGAFRTFALLFNEAVSAVAERLASAADVDLAMRLGVNYPAGPLEWGERLGLADLLESLAGLHAEVGAERFAPHPLLKRLVAAGGARLADLATFAQPPTGTVGNGGLGDGGPGDGRPGDGGGSAGGGGRGAPSGRDFRSGRGSR